MREKPAAGDVVMPLLGGRTGRDGIGGANCLSKEHTVESVTTCGSEVQREILRQNGSCSAFPEMRQQVK